MAQMKKPPIPLYAVVAALAFSLVLAAPDRVVGAPALESRFASLSPAGAQAATKSCGAVNVAAASDLTFAMNEIAAEFQKETGCTLRLSLGSSGNFLTQIENGAPFDVFLSADIAYPKKLESEGLAAPDGT